MKAELPAHCARVRAPLASAPHTPPTAAVCADAVTDALDGLRARGYIILKDLVPLVDIERIVARLEPWFVATPLCQGDFYGWHTTRFGRVLMKSPETQCLLLHPMILALMDALLGPHCDWYQLNLSQAVRVHPGERRQVPHRDDEMWPGAKAGIEYLVNVMWALSDFSADNGATLLWPRSQHHAASRNPDLNHAVAAAMTRGSALVYLGSVTHSGGSNRTSLPRTGLIFSYSLGWLKQYENAFLSYPPEVAAQLPSAVRDLLGYRIHRPNLGNYEGQDPSVLLAPPTGPMATVDALSAATAQEIAAFHRE